MLLPCQLFLAADASQLASTGGGEPCGSTAISPTGARPIEGHRRTFALRVPASAGNRGSATELLLPLLPRV